MAAPPVDPLLRAFGILAYGGGEFLMGYVVDDNRTDIRMQGLVIGGIVRDPGTGRWTYDKTLRDALAIADDPIFENDDEAAKDLQDRLPDDERMNKLARALIDPVRH